MKYFVIIEMEACKYEFGNTILSELDQVYRLTMNLKLANALSIVYEKPVKQISFINNNILN